MNTNNDVVTVIRSIDELVDKMIAYDVEVVCLMPILIHNTSYSAESKWWLPVEEPPLQ